MKRQGNERFGWMVCVALLASAGVQAQEEGGPLEEQPGNGAPEQGAVVAYAASLVFRSNVERTDNAFRSAENEQADTLGAVGMNLDLHHERSKVLLNAISDLEWREYAEDSFGGRLYGRFEGLARLGAVNDPLQWTIEDTFGQVRRDATDVFTPANLENVNYFSTGPTLALGAGSGNELTLSGYYSLTTYEESPFDSRSVVGDLELLHAVTPRTRVSLNGKAEHVQYQDLPSNNDYDAYQGYVSFQTGNRRTTLRLDAGYDQLRANDDSKGGTLFALDLSRRTSAFSLISLELYSRLTSVADSLRTNPGIVAIADTTSDLAAFQPYRDRAARGEWLLRRPRTSIDLAGFWHKNRYFGLSALDRSYWGYDVILVRRMRPTLSGQIAFTSRRENFKTLVADNTEQVLVAALFKDIGQRMSFFVRYQRLRRTAVDDTTEYNENRYGLGLTYRVLGPGGGAQNLFGFGLPARE